MNRIFFYLFIIFLLAFKTAARISEPLTGQFQQIVLKIADLYDCKNIAHLPDDNTTAADDIWMSYFKDHIDLHVALLSNYNNSIELPGRHPYRLCVTSFSPWALKNATFLQREFKRPVKIYLDLNVAFSVPITYWYRNNGTDFDSPPLISLHSASHRFAQAKIVCPDTNDYQSLEFLLNERKWEWYGNPNLKQALCPPALKGKILKAAFMPVSPFVYFRDEELVGGEPAIFRLLAEINEFIPTFYMEKGWIGFDDDGRVWGNIGAVHYKHAHVAFGSHYINELYCTYVDVLPAYSYKVHYQSAKPTKLPPYLNMTKPFTIRTWILSAVSVIFIMVAFPIFAHITNHRKHDWFMNSLEMLGHLLSQGLREGERTSVNAFLITWVWFAFFLHAMYDCNLRAYMMAADTSPLVDEVKDIWYQDRCLYFTSGYDESATYEALPEDFEYEKLVMRKSYRIGCQYWFDENGYFPVSLESAIINDKAVIMMSDMQFYSNYAMETRRRWGYDPFRISKQASRVYHKHSGLPIQKDSVLKEVFDPQVLAMRSSGIMMSFVPRLWMNEEIEEPLDPIDLRHFLLGLGILAGGLVLSFVALLSERVLHGGQWKLKKKQVVVI